MYYLDFHQLYKQTQKESRTEVRRAMNRVSRDAIMAKRIKHQHGICFYCTEPITMKDHLDHLIPVYYGGTNRPVNLVGACRLCNITKMTDQIEITNPYTISEYLTLKEARKKWNRTLAKHPQLKRYTPKRARLYKIYRVDLFKNL